MPNQTNNREKRNMDKKEERGKCLLSALGKGKSYGSPLWTATIGGKLELSYLRDLLIVHLNRHPV